MQVEDSGGVSGAKDDEDAFEDSAAAQAAAFAGLDPEARRLVLESIAGAVSDDDDEDDDSAALAAALVADAERLERQELLVSDEHMTAEPAWSAEWDGTERGRHALAVEGVATSGHSNGDGSSTSSRGSAEHEVPPVPSEDWTASLTAASSQSTAASSCDKPGVRSGISDAADTVASGLDALRPLSTDVDELLDDEESEPADWVQRDPEAVNVCIAASGDWSRIVR